MKNWVIKEKRSWRDPMRTNSYYELTESRESGTHTDAVIDAQYHPVATFLQLIRRLLAGPEATLRILAVETKSFSVLGALLQKLPGHLIDGTSLFEVQNLLETFNEQAEPDLAAAIRHFLLFDFRLWVHSTYTTRVSHIQVKCQSKLLFFFFFPKLQILVLIS